MKVKKSLLNILSGICGQIITIALGIIIPRLVLVNLGSEINGLLNSINQVLVYIALLEAGVGTATIQALYGPIAKKEELSINQILSATSQYYKRTSVIYLLVVMAVSLVFPLIIITTVSKAIIIVVIILSGLPGVINFYYQGKFKLLLQAEGKSYIITNLVTIIQIATSVSKILLLLSGFGVVALQIMYLLFSMAQMIFISIYIKRHYKWLDLSVKPDYDSISQKKSVLIHQISTLIFSNTDTLIISVFLGLKLVSVYSMYKLLFSMIGTMIQNINSGVIFLLGQTYYSDKSEFIKMHDAFELYNMTLTFSMFCIANIFLLPFLNLYTTGVTDINYIDKTILQLFIVTFLLSNGRTSSAQVIVYAGHFKLTQWRSVLESSINILVSVVLVQFIGIYGVLVGTIVALLYRTNDMILYASHNIMHRKAWIVYRRWFVNCAVYAGFTIINGYLNLELNSYTQIFVWACVAVIMIVPIFFIITSLFDKPTYFYVLNIIKTQLKKVFRSKIITKSN